MMYLVEVHSNTAKESLRWNIPLTVRTGETQDISPLLLFQFFEPVYYAHDPSFPDSKERLGYWVGPSKHVGDSLCHTILDSETFKEHHTSIVRPVKTNPNFRVGVPANVRRNLMPK